jgi:hypothetical protein
MRGRVLGDRDAVVREEELLESRRVALERLDARSGEV